MGVKKWLIIGFVVLAVVMAGLIFRQTQAPTESTGPISGLAAATTVGPEGTATPSSMETPVPVTVPETTAAPTQVPATVPERTVAPTQVPTAIPQSTAVPTSVPATMPELTPAPTMAPIQSDSTRDSQTHVHSAKLDEKEATCLEPGYRKEVCSDCGEVLWGPEKTEALGHDFEKSIWESPTCQMSGYYNNVCKRCGIVESVTEDKLPHEVEDIIVQEGNCMEDTVISHVCKNCGTKVESDTRYTPYDLHSWNTEVVDGVTITCCSNCGVVK